MTSTFVISRIPRSDRVEEVSLFEKILSMASRHLEDQFKDSSIKEISKLSGSIFESYVEKSLNNASKGSVFENSFELVSGQKFPDIVSKIKDQNLYGVEVKTSKGNWTCPGGSIFEGTKLTVVNDIYLIFGKLSEKLDVRWGQYGDCVEDIKVTHKPRYFLNMDIKKSTVFDQIGMDYYKFSDLSDREKASTFKEYKKISLKENADVWWLDEHNLEESADLLSKVQLFGDLTANQKKQITAEGYVLFPEVLSSDYKRFVKYLVGQKGVIIPNVRDQFTGGGRKTIEFKSKPYNVSNALKKLEKHKQLCLNFINDSSTQTLSSFWDIEETLITDKSQMWAKILKSHINADFLSKNASEPLPFIDWLLD